MGVNDCQEKAHKKKGNGALCAIHLPTRCLCLLGKQIMWRVLFCFLIKILCGSFSASVMSYKDKMKIPKLKFWKANQKGIAVLWNEGEVNRGLSSGLKLILPLWQYIFPGRLLSGSSWWWYGNLALWPALLAPLSLLLGLSICFFYQGAIPE